MHVLGIKQEIVERHPWVPINMFHAFNEAKAIAMKRMENPRIVPLVWYREAWEEQEEIVGDDPWEYGPTDRNIQNVTAIAGLLPRAGLEQAKFVFDDLFAPVFQGRKRGDEFRFLTRHASVACRIAFRNNSRIRCGVTGSRVTAPGIAIASSIALAITPPAPLMPPSPRALEAERMARATARPR